MAISKELKSIIESQPDILSMDAIQVTTGINGNDDVFTKDELWKARKTPFLKPVNWEHETGKEVNDENSPKSVVSGNQIIGATFNCFATDDSGAIIADDASEVPSKFHLVTQDVIWKYNFPKTAARIQDGAKNKTLFVSMEAWFNDYDYLVGNKIVARNEETAFLDNYLRAYGGTGQYSGSKVGRVLRNIVFGGKGVVKRPANKESVILSVGENKTEELEMPKEVEVAVAATIVDVEPLNKEIAELKRSLENRDKNLETIKKTLASTVDKLAEVLGAQGETLKKAAANIYADWAVTFRGYEYLDMSAFSGSLTQLFSDMMNQNKEAVAKLATSESTLAKLSAEKLLADRLTKVESALGSEVKNKSAEAVAKMTDEQFISWLDSLVSIKATLSPTPVKVEASQTVTETDNDETEVLESVQATEASVPAGNEVNQELDISNNMQHLVNQMLGITKEGN